MLLVILVAVAVGFSSAHFFHMKPDNPVEEIAEEVIKEETGFDVDFTPNSGPERKCDYCEDYDDDLDGNEKEEMTK